MSCEKANITDPKLSFYYWKTDFKLTPKERQSLKELDVTRLYIRYFDIALKGNDVIPVMPVLFKDSIRVTQKIIPVVYVKNEVMLSPNTNVKELTEKTLRLIEQINHLNDIEINEIQLDCDWSLKSKERFLAFVEEMKKQSQLKISTTIRLHQIKYAAKTGIPDVDYGVLMYYNMGQIASDSLNSIYDKSIANTYIQSLRHYPKELKVALPIYSWIIQSRDGKIVRLISRVRKEDVSRQNHVEPLDENRFIVTSSTEMFGQFFIKNDQIKIESISEDALLEMAKDLKNNSPHPIEEIILYDLEEKNIQAYEKNFFKKMVQYF